LILQPTSSPKVDAVVELCIHVANVFYLASFLGRDMLWLRVLTCAGLVLGIVFFSCQKIPMYGPTAWHIAFLGINGVQIARLVSERRQLRLTDEQARFGEARYGDLTRDELLALLTRVTSVGESGIPVSGEIPLGRDETVLRDLAFRHLTRHEIVNLLTRRAWHAFRQRKLAHWRWQRHRDRSKGVAHAGREPVRETAAR
jgi:hypothetical protein